MRAPASASPLSRGVFRLHCLIAIFLVIAAAAILTLRPITDSDFWHHIAIGRILIEEGRFPVGDELSSTAAGRPWVSSGWLPAAALYKAYISYPVSGPVGGIVLGVIISSALLLLFYGFRRTENPTLAALLVILALAAAFPRFLPRPDLFSQALMVPLIILLAWYEESPLTYSAHNVLRAALLPLLFLVWANCHMLFVIGFAIASLYVLWALMQWKKGRRADGRVTIIMWAVSAAACLATPYGIRAFWFIFENARLNETSSRINELKPSWLLAAEPGGMSTLILFGLWLVAAAWLVWRHRSGDHGWWRWGVIAFLLALALIQRRQISVAVFGITPLVFAAVRGPALPRMYSSAYAMLGPLVLVIGFMGARFAGYLPPLPAGPPRLGIDCNWLPCEAIDFLEENPPPAALFHDLYTGGFLAYHLAPETKVFIDGRLEVYNNGTYDDFFAPPEGRMPLKELFTTYNVHTALLDWRAAAQQPGHTAAVLASQPDWRLCWFSDHYALFVHQDDSTTSYTGVHAYTYLNPLMPQRYIDALADPATAAPARAEAARALSDNPGSHLAQKAAEVAGMQISAPASP